MRELLDDQPDFGVIDAVASGEEALSVAEHEELDVVVLDYQLGGRNGLWAGFSGRQIAEALVISEKTVERHRANILERLGMHDRVELTRSAIRRGLIEP